MLLIFINVIYVLTAIAMIVLILLQRGSGGAGSGFGGGGGASATVFGARGSANFLSKATKWLAVVFFSISLGLAIYASKPHTAATSADDLGVMGHAPAAASTPAVPQPTGTATPAPAVTTPAVPTPAVPQPVQGAPAQAVPANAVPANPAPQPAASAPNTDNGAKPGNKGG
jgi:preprotein translocase subunit SecG